MNIRKHFSAATLAFAIMSAAMPARAGIPTIDIAAITQAIMQVQAWSQQYQQMTQQFQQLQQILAGDAPLPVGQFIIIAKLALQYSIYTAQLLFFAQLHPVVG